MANRACLEDAAEIGNSRRWLRALKARRKAYSDRELVRLLRKSIAAAKAARSVQS